MREKYTKTEVSYGKGEWGHHCGICKYFRLPESCVEVEGKIEEDEAASMLEFALPTMLEFFGLLRLKIFLRNIRRATRGEAIVPVPPGDAKGT